MMTNMNCDQALPLVWSYLDGELTEAQAQPLRKHLLECAACRNGAQDGKSLKRWFVEPAGAEIAPIDFASRVARAAFAERRRASELELDEPMQSTAIEETPIYPFVLRLIVIAAALLFVLSIVMRFQALPQTTGLRADDRTQLDDENVRQLLDRLHAADPNDARVPHSPAPQR
jgi:anti-sigma factor RsiW